MAERAKEKDEPAYLSYNWAKFLKRVTEGASPFLIENLTLFEAD